MKRLAFIPALLVAAFLALPFSAQAEEKVLRIGIVSDPESFDPHMQLSGPILSYSHWVFDPLVRWDHDMSFEPRLATSWEQIDPTTMRFKLREGVKFHSGNPFTAKDVVWTLDRLKESADFRGLFGSFTAVAVDDYTLDIKTPEPYGLVMNLATYIFPMDSVFYTGTDKNGNPKDMISKTDYTFANENASGTGPFKAISREAGVNVQLERNADYWDKETGNVDKVDLQVVSEGATRVAGIMAGNVDFMTPVPVQDYEQLEKNPNVNLITQPSTRVIVFQMNGEKNPALANPRVREAIVKATDNIGIAKKVMRGSTIAVHQQAPKGMQGYDEALGSRYNLAEAKAIIDELYPDGLELDMITPNDRYVNDEKIAQAFVPMMAKIGIKVNLRTFPKTQYWNEYDAFVGDIQMVGWHPDTEDTVNYGEYLLMCRNAETGKGQYNSGHWCNEEYDAIMNVANQETDMAKRTEMLKKAEKLAYDDYAFIPLHLEPLSWASGPALTNPQDIVTAMDFLYLGDAVMK